MREAAKRIPLVRVFFIALLFAISINSPAAEDIPPPEIQLDNSACIDCHQSQHSSLIADWENSAHAKTDPVVNCVSCHGGRHQDMLIHARRDGSCIDCHGGKKDPVVHSYSFSKHGTLMKLEHNNYDWNRSFEFANYRAPGCGYCHMHQKNHNISATVRHDLMNDSETEKVQQKTRAVCQDCHSPRYITDLFSNGEAMLEIARKKSREASSLIAQAGNIFTDEELVPAKKQFKKMQQHLVNVYLGVGHQSPDYQWWHGQPALDGDLLRIKDSIGQLYRQHQ